MLFSLASCLPSPARQTSQAWQPAASSMPTTALYTPTKTSAAVATLAVLPADRPGQRTTSTALPSPTWKPTSAPPIRTPPGKAPTASQTTSQSLLALQPIQIRSPGSGSQVLSPLSLEVQFAPGEAGQRIRIELYGQDGILLVRKLFERQRLPASGLYADKLEFESAASPRAAFLVVALDNPAGIPLAASAVDIDLLVAGNPRLRQAGSQAEAIVIQDPAPQAKVAGGLLSISGMTSLDPASPLKVQVIDPAGKVLGQRLAKIEQDQAGPFRPFAAQVPYQVDDETNAWVIVFRDLPPGGQILFLASQPVQLKP